MFKSTNGQGFHIKFQNGYTVSVQWGAVHQCANYGTFDPLSDGRGCENAEVAIVRDGVVLDMSEFIEGADMTAGYCSAEQVAAILSLVAAL